MFKGNSASNQQPEGEPKRFLLDVEELKDVRERYLLTVSDQADSDGADSGDGND